MNVTARSLAGQTAIITGGSSGIGASVVRALAMAGAAVVLTFHSGSESAKALAAEITAAGGQALAVQTDVSQEAQVEALFRETERHVGPPDILVANAGLQQDASFAKMTLEQWRAVLDTNLTGQFLCAREAVRSFRRRGVRSDVSRALGKIICMSSVHDVIPWAGHVNYAASKGGVSLMMRSLAQEVASERIRVNAVAPGAIRTPINREAWETPEAEARLLRLIPYGRIGEPEDIAKAVVWLASDDSDYVVGTTLYVDGGMTLYPAFLEGG
jgi:glucose 1-dehydrogenase